MFIGLGMIFDCLGVTVLGQQRRLGWIKRTPCICNVAAKSGGMAWRNFIFFRGCSSTHHTPMHTPCHSDVHCGRALGEQAPDPNASYIVAAMMA